MCTLVVLYRPDDAWPVLMAANRDERLDRPSRPPGRHWPDRRHVVAGFDAQGGGSWFGLNDDGLAAGIMNRAGTLGAAPGKRSRGELVLEALDHAEAESAAAALRHVNPAAYRAFNLVIADARSVYWLRHTESGPEAGIEVMPLAAGLSLLTAHDLNDLSSPRIRQYLPRFRAAAVPEPDRGEWSAWEALLGSRAAAGGDPFAAMNIATERGFGTVSSLLLALPAHGRSGIAPRFRFAAGPPDVTPFRDVPLS